MTIVNQTVKDMDKERDMVRLRTATIALVVAVAWMLPGGTAHGGYATAAQDVSTFTIELAPGICVPGDTDDCVGPTSTEFHVTADSCTITGVFEGATLAQDTPCDFELFGFVEPLPGASKPVCGGTSFYTSDDTTAFGEGNTSTFSVDGEPRSIFLEGMAVATDLVITGWLDDDDTDSDPIGDHRILAPVNAVRAVAQEGTIPCVTTPGTEFFGAGTATFS